jgi:hypothetical protein
LDVLWAHAYTYDSRWDPAEGWELLQKAQQEGEAT